MRVVNSLDSRGHRISHTRTFSYPGWDSNPHCFRSERNASCRLGYLGVFNVVNVWTVVNVANVLKYAICYVVGIAHIVQVPHIDHIFAH